MLKQRIITGIILIPLFLIAVIKLDTKYIALIMALLILAGAWEWSRLLKIKMIVLRVVYVLAIALFLWLGWRYLEARGSIIPMLSAAACWWLLALFWIFIYPLGDKNNALNQLVKSFVGVLVLVPAWVAVVKMHSVDYRWFLYLMVLIWIADSGAYFAGKTWGKHKLAPKVSPGKSWEGVYGAVTLSAIYAYGGTYWLDIPPGNTLVFVLISLAIVPVSVLGDLFESMIKRHSGYKDSGQLLPGHGGVLDRIDSITSAAPLFLLGIIVFDIMK